MYYIKICKFKFGMDEFIEFVNFFKQKTMANEITTLSITICQSGDIADK